MSTDPLLDVTIKRFAFHPTRYPKLYELFKAAEASFWTTDEVDLSGDVADFTKLTSEEQSFILTVLAFFASADGIVNENIVQNFSVEIQSWEARCFYGQQIAIENTHAIMYSLLLQTLEQDAHRRSCLFSSIETHPSIQGKAQWAMRWFDRDRSFATRLVAFACVEGIFFSSSFCAIFYMKKRGLMPGLAFSNELISRDEGLHCTFACSLYAHLAEQLSDDVVLDIVGSAVQAELAFVDDALPVNIIGMNAEKMQQYVRFVADHLLFDLGVAKKYNVENPFEWMHMISLQGKTNFFEKRVGEYQKSKVPVNSTADNFSVTTDF